MIAEEAASGSIRLRAFQSQEMGRVKALTPKAQDILNHIDCEFEKIAAEGNLIKEISVQPGECVVFNNAWGTGELGGVLHGRSGQVSHPSRWLQRALLRRAVEADEKSEKRGRFQESRQGCDPCGDDE